MDNKLIHFQFNHGYFRPNILHEVFKIKTQKVITIEQKALSDLEVRKMILKNDQKLLQDKITIAAAQMKRKDMSTEAVARFKTKLEEYNLQLTTINQTLSDLS
ncbi:MAG: hypothetical protein Q7R33_04760 [Nitrosarchaeum sp.]|nr:hypothetical protein [Nitrosarchaeum sp.]